MQRALYKDGSVVHVIQREYGEVLLEIHVWVCWKAIFV